LDFISWINFSFHFLKSISNYIADRQSPPFLLLYPNNIIFETNSVGLYLFNNYRCCICIY